MCNTCGCKAAEDSMVRKHRTMTKKQRQDMQDAVQDVDYMREKFQAMEVFPAGQHDIDEARRVLETMYSNIEIYDVIYMTKKTGKTCRTHSDLWLKCYKPKRTFSTTFTKLENW